MYEFKKLYLFAMRSKFYIALYFMALLILSGILYAFMGHWTMGLVTMLQMLVLCSIIGLFNGFWLCSNARRKKVRTRRTTPHNLSMQAVRKFRTVQNETNYQQKSCPKDKTFIKPESKL